MQDMNLFGTTSKPDRRWNDIAVCKEPSAANMLSSGQTEWFSIAVCEVAATRDLLCSCAAK